MAALFTFPSSKAQVSFMSFMSLANWAGVSGGKGLASVVSKLETTSTLLAGGQEGEGLGRPARHQATSPRLQEARPSDAELLPQRHPGRSHGACQPCQVG